MGVNGYLGFSILVMGDFLGINTDLRINHISIPYPVLLTNILK